MLSCFQENYFGGFQTIHPMSSAARRFDSHVDMEVAEVDSQQADTTPSRHLNIDVSIEAGHVEAFLPKVSV